MSTKRYEALKAIQTILSEIAPITPEPDPADPNDWPFKFTFVNLGPLGEPDFRKAYTAGIVAGRERKIEKFPLVECHLPVAIEFQGTRNRDSLEPADMAEQMLGVVQRALMQDRNLKGTVVDVKETGNEVDLETYGDRSVVGALYVEIIYRHRHDDPREL